MRGPEKMASDSEPENFDGSPLKGLQKLLKCTLFFRGGLWKQTHFQTGHSRSSMVIALGTNWKHVWHFLLVINGNFGPIWPRFKDIACFLLKKMTPPVFHLNFKGVPIGPDNWSWGIEKWRLISREIIIEVFQPIWSPYLKVTDRQTDGPLSVASLFYCVASHGAKYLLSMYSTTHIMWKWLLP